MGAGHGGQILLSNTAAGMLRDTPAGDLVLVELGRVALKDFPEAEPVWQVLAPGLARDFPPLRSAVARGNLPTEMSSLIGRKSEIDRVAEGVRTSRLVTLTGAGGVGKTRLALAAARALGEEMSGGAWLVELASAHAGDDVETVVAATVGFVPRAGISARATLVEGIGERKVLLVLDNCEHVLDAVASFAAHVLGQCGGLAIITTSREPLGIDGEIVVGVPSLDVATDAFELFVTRATAIDAGFVPEPRTSSRTSAVASMESRWRSSSPRLEHARSARPRSQRDFTTTSTWLLRAAVGGSSATRPCGRRSTGAGDYLASRSATRSRGSRCSPVGSTSTRRSR